MTATCGHYAWTAKNGTVPAQAAPSTSAERPPPTSTDLFRGDPSLARGSPRHARDRHRLTIGERIAWYRRRRACHTRIARVPFDPSAVSPMIGGSTSRLGSSRSVAETAVGPSRPFRWRRRPSTGAACLAPLGHHGAVLRGIRRPFPLPRRHLMVVVVPADASRFQCRERVEKPIRGLWAPTTPAMFMLASAAFWRPSSRKPVECSNE